MYWIIGIQAVKGLVHPKMKILSVFTHPHVVPTSEHKLRYLRY